MVHEGRGDIGGAVIGGRSTCLRLLVEEDDVTSGIVMNDPVTLVAVGLNARRRQCGGLDGSGCFEDRSEGCGGGERGAQGAGTGTAG